MAESKDYLSLPTIGKKIEYASSVLMKQDDIQPYLDCMGSVLAEAIHYIDPVHELHGKTAVLEMLAKYVPRLKKEPFQFSLIHETDSFVIWKWVLNMKIRFSPFRFTIHGLVHAEVENGKIVRQREYYDPMESIGVIPVVGFLYKLVLKMG
ncbi:MAG: nuclear transport factor 2 family protein [Deltaproteobacteria bacterium]